MFWWFERGGRYIRFESHQMTAGQFELRIIDPDGTERVEHFTDSRDLARRQDDVIDEITQEGWSGPHGWVL